MSGVVQTLEKKIVIRIFGVVLFFSPFVNTILAMALQRTAKNKWTVEQMWRVIDTTNTTNNVLTVGALLLGVVMLTGSTKAWKFTLVLLGGFIAVQLKRLDYDIHVHWIYGVFFLINVGAFAFIADQLVFKQKFDIPQGQPGANSLKPYVAPPPVKQEAPPPVVAVAPTPVAPPPVALKKTPPVPYHSKNTVFLAFDNQRPWAKLISISTQGLEIKALIAPPSGIENRDIIIHLSKDIPLRLRYQKHSNDYFHFEFVNLNPQQAFTINNWLVEKAKAA